jgi:hypothetical protein
MKKIDWIYKNDTENKFRYVLGIKGENPLVCFGINPSTAIPDHLDNTLKSVERLSLSNGFDSWVMMNIYPQRATNPKDIHEIIDNEIHQRNLDFIRKMFSLKKVQIWAAWGTLIEKRPFLIPCLVDIYNLSLKYNCSWVRIGEESIKGHPHHPLYLNSSEIIKPFHIEKYIEKISSGFIKS